MVSGYNQRDLVEEDTQESPPPCIGTSVRPYLLTGIESRRHFYVWKAVYACPTSVTFNWHWVLPRTVKFRIENDQFREEKCLVFEVVYPNRFKFEFLKYMSEWT